MSESAEVISNADASYGTDTETLPDVDIPNPNSLEENPNKEKSSRDIIRETADNVQSCRVCYDEFHTSKNQARVLGCGHTFCTRCVIKCSNPNNQNIMDLGIKCPECRKISELAPATVPVNFQLMQILAVLSLVKEPQTSEQEKDLAQYENLDRLGTQIPSNTLADLSINDLYEHMKAVFNAIRLRSRKDKDQAKTSAVMKYDNELRKMEDVERNMNQIVHNLTRLKSGELVRDSFFPFPLWPPDIPERRSFHDSDWMREMVVFRPPVSGGPIRPPFSPPQVPANPPVQDVDTVLEREQAARAEADPRRSLHVVREALLRRERESAQERETANRNEQFMRQLLDRNENMLNIRNNINEQIDMLPLPRNELGRELAIRRSISENRERENLRRIAAGLPSFLLQDDVTIDDDNVTNASDNSSLFEDRGPRSDEQPMTIGEAITMYRMVEVFSPRVLRQSADSFALPNDHPSLNSLVQELLPHTASVTDTMHPSQINDLHHYCHSNDVDCNRLLRNLREHSVRYAPTILESPRVIERRLHQRTTASDNYNARLTIIRKRAMDALSGDRPIQPSNGEETDLTIRLIVNLASLMGVRDELDEIICPQHRAKEEDNELFVRRTSSSTRQDMLFCTACRCEVPMGSKQVHAQGRRHMANIANRSQSRQQH